MRICSEYVSTQSLVTVILEYIDVGVDWRRTAACRRQRSEEVVCLRWRDDQLAFAPAEKRSGWGGRRRKGREDVVSVVPGYPWEIGSTTRSVHREYQNPWVCTSADSTSLNMDWRRFEVGSWAHGPPKRFETATIQPIRMISNSVWRWKHFSARPARGLVYHL